jgi:hypothetical protein
LRIKKKPSEDGFFNGRLILKPQFFYTALSHAGWLQMLSNVSVKSFQMKSAEPYINKII